MKKVISIAASLLSFGQAVAQNRFPKPDFESGYQYPDAHVSVPFESFWEVADIVLLVLLMGIVAWATLKRRTRMPVIAVSILSVAYFGFFRSGCVCSIGSIQNVALSLVDSSYVLPLSVILLFLLPIVFAFLFGRVFCAGVCPFGAIQELVNVRSYKLSKAVTTVLEMLPWIYLIFALLYAVTRSSFIICRFDPFIGIFRLGGDVGLLLFGALLLIASVFTGRPFCRFLCPYGALLSLFSRISIWGVKITTKSCINCELCHNACPVDTIKPPYSNKVKENRLLGVKRILGYAVLLPLLMVAGAYLMYAVSDKLSRNHKTVRLYELVMQYEANSEAIIPLEVESFHSQGGNMELLEAQYEGVRADYALYSPIAGALLGLLVAMTLINLSLKRTRREYEIEAAACVSCARCFNYCPQNKLP